MINTGWDPGMNPELLWAFLGLIALISLNAALGILKSFVDKEFESDHVADYLRKHLLPDGGTIFLLGLTATVSPEARVLFWAAVAAGTVKYVGKIKEKLIGKGLAEG